jgi:ABC-2 type transport system ATP-binding protein
MKSMRGELTSPRGHDTEFDAPIEAHSIEHAFGRKRVLNGIDFRVPAGRIHALLGPNGAGKTTLLRIFTGLLVPNAGTVTIAGVDVARAPRTLRKLIGFVPSGDRSFYLRISGFENLVFFGRLHGMRRRAAADRARQVLAEVGLVHAGGKMVGLYSHGMQKRLSVARALLLEPPVLFVDEATHDLDPDGARRVRELVSAAADRGAAVVWATQRLDEIRGLVDRVTLLSTGEAVFEGTVPELMAHAVPRRYLVRLQNGRPAAYALDRTGTSALDGLGRLENVGDDASEHYVLALEEHAVLGDALARLTGAQISVLTCREERSEIEEAFLKLAVASE